MRLPITDFALACATGPRTQVALDTIFAGESGLAEEDSLLVGRVGDPLDALEPRFEEFDTRQARLAQLTISPMRDSIQAARERWGPRRVGLLVGTSTGGIAWTETAYRAAHEEQGHHARSVFTRHAFGAVVDYLKRAFELEGPGYCVSTACSSSTHILGSAQRLIASGTVDAVLAIGIDTLCHLTLRGFGGLGLLSAGQSRPFDAERDGINIGEAGAALLVERHSDDATSWLRGFGTSSDGYHMTSPPPDGAGAIASMTQALANAEIDRAQIVAINAHGTGTVANDAAEALAIASVFGDDAVVVSTKGYTGHTLGACGAVEAVICIESLRRQQVPGTFGLRTLDAALPVRASAARSSVDGKFMMSNNFAFGGNNATIILEQR